MRGYLEKCCLTLGLNLEMDGHGKPGVVVVQGRYARHTSNRGLFTLYIRSSFNVHAPSRLPIKRIESPIILLVKLIGLYVSSAARRRCGETCCETFSISGLTFQLCLSKLQFSWWKRRSAGDWARLVGRPVTKVEGVDAQPA